MKFVTLKLFCPDHHQIAVILIFPEPEMRDRERRDKPAHCRGWKSPTEKEKRLYSGLESCLRSREG